MPKGVIEAVGEYASDGVVLLIHGGIFELEVFGEFLSVMGNVLQIYQLIHFNLFQKHIVSLSIIYSGFMTIVQRFTLLG